VTVLGTVALWRVQILSSGTITIGDRTLDFTPGHREAIAEAFRAGALEVVPFTLGDTFTGDPCSLSGEVRGLEVVEDGVDAVIAVSEWADEVIRDSLRPGRLPVAAVPCLIENYLHPGGLPFPVVLLRVLGTTRPMITGLRGWRELEAAS
jgi:hypothetical protein